ncbi:protease [Herbaspirillum sp. RTI4]|uniref:protease n=1 Tax=Herbaspirillum sp. RTI4 TaxID=3048640 RepID=UPI002AB5937A|nr:protease [Herbaspirillum sp. RTI4]MDY7579358.1 protease [Herbaspirillum sp. RTI4]MEA9980272.1 protease [Herbaspirillum sp. RTI4]
MTTETTAAPAGNTPSTEAVAAPATAIAAATPADATPAAPAAIVPAEAPTASEEPQAPAPKAPEKYDFKTVDGKVDTSVLTKFESVARELDLTQDQAAKLIDTLAPQVAQAQKARQDAQVSAWADAAKADKEIGGDKLNENLAIAKKALDTFGTPELTKMLNDSGMGNHPEIIRAFLRAGQKISPGNFVPSGQGTSQTSNASSKLYPSMK